MSDNPAGRFVRVDSVLYERMADGTWSAFQGKTDWVRLAAMTEEEIEANALSDADSLPFSDEE